MQSCCCNSRYESFKAHHHLFGSSKRQGALLHLPLQVQGKLRWFSSCHNTHAKTKERYARGSMQIVNPQVSQWISHLSTKEGGHEHDDNDDESILNCALLLVFDESVKRSENRPTLYTSLLACNIMVPMYSYCTFLTKSGKFFFCNMIHKSRRAHHVPFC